MLLIYYEKTSHNHINCIPEDVDVHFIAENGGGAEAFYIEKDRLQVEVVPKAQVKK